MLQGTDEGSVNFVRASFCFVPSKMTRSEALCDHDLVVVSLGATNLEQQQKQFRIEIAE